MTVTKPLALTGIMVIAGAVVLIDATPGAADSEVGTGIGNTALGAGPVLGLAVCEGSSTVEDD